MPRIRTTIALRLTLWYGAIFFASSALAMALVYSGVVGVLRRETDEELRQDLEETVAVVRRGGVAAFREEVAVELAGPDSAAVFLRLWSDAEVPLASAGFGPAGESILRAVNEQRHRVEPTLHTMRQEGFEHAVRVGTAGAGGDFVVEFGQSLEEDERLVGALRTGVLVALPAALLLGVPIGWFMARRALRGVGTMTRTAIDIAGGAIERRVPESGEGDELDRLARAFNGMLDRIQALITGMREVTDNLAHDMRTPLALIRASAERAALRGATPEEWATFAGTTTEECDRLLLILNSSLEIAEAQAGAARLRLEVVDLAGLVGEAREIFLAAAEDAGIALETKVPAACPARVDRGRIQRIVANLLDNALKYTPRGGVVTISLTEEAGGIRLDVRDTGIGVSAEDLPRIFERFFRGDGSRSGGGSGLGLSLARAFARAHGGDLTATSAPGRGSVFTLRLRRGGA